MDGPINAVCGSKNLIRDNLWELGDFSAFAGFVVVGWREGDV